MIRVNLFLSGSCVIMLFILQLFAEKGHLKVFEWICFHREETWGPSACLCGLWVYWLSCIKWHCIRPEDCCFSTASLLITSEVPRSKGPINIYVWAVGWCLKPRLQWAEEECPFMPLKRLLSLCFCVCVSVYFSKLKRKLCYTLT